MCALLLAVAGCAQADDGPQPGGSVPEGSVDGHQPAPDVEAPAVDEPEGPPEDPEDEDQDLHAEPVEVAEPYEPVDGEIRPNAKRLAARVAEALTTYEVDATLQDVAAEVTDGERAEQLQQDAEPLWHEDAWSRGRVLYPQLGGMLENATSVMVVVEQTVGLPDGEVLEEVRTLDVRLWLVDGAWAFDELASAGGEPVERPEDLPGVAEEVLDDERIGLPDTAVWDIHDGGIDEHLLTLMSRMAEITPYGVVVFDTGHPWEIYGTDRQSKHSMGKAVDIHALGQEPVLVIADRFAGSATHELVHWLYDQPELSQVGSPWALDGFGGRSFTDQLHQDHLHVAVH